MAQPPQTSGYGLITDIPDDYGLSNQYIRESRLQTERAKQEEAARKRRQEALDSHLRQYDDDPISRAVATIDFEKKEADDYRAAQKAATEKEHEKIKAQYDDPIAQAWAILQHEDEKGRNLPAKQAFADQEAIERLDKRDQTANKLDRVGLGNAFLRETIGSAVNVVPDLAAVPARGMEAVGLAEPGTANELHRESSAFQDARQQSRQDDMSPWLSRMYGGASQSLMQMGATPGGPVSKIVGSGVMAGDQALTTAEDAGLEGADRLRYAGTQGLLEAGIAAIGQKYLGGGIESRLAGQAVAAQTWKELAKNVGMDALKEMPEEAVTAILQDVSSKLEGVSPDLQFADFVTNAVEASVQAAMMAPMANAGNTAGMAWRSLKPTGQPPASQAPDEPSPEPTIPPAVEAFANDDTPSRKTYDAAVKAGMPPIPSQSPGMPPSLQSRQKYAADLRKRFGAGQPKEDAVSSDATATLEPATTDPAINPATEPDINIDDILNIMEKGDTNEAEIQAGQASEANVEWQAQTEGVLTEQRPSADAYGASPDQSQPLTETDPVSKLPEHARLEKGDDGLFYPGWDKPGKAPQTAMMGFKTEQEAMKWFEPRTTPPRPIPAAEPLAGSIGWNDSGLPIYESKTGLRTVGDETEQSSGLKDVSGKMQATLAAPREDRFKTDEELAAGPNHVGYHSGLSRSPAEVDEAISTKTPVGVSAFASLSAPMRKKLVDYADDGGKVFIDSGAFTAFKKGKELDWDKVFFTYREMISSVKPDKRANVTIVAPDIVGEHDGTIDLQQKLAYDFEPFFDSGATVIFPVQKGGHGNLQGNFADLTDTFGDNMEFVTVGVPFTAEAWGQEDVLDFMRFRDQHDPGRRFHLLGAGPPKVAKLFAAAEAEGLSLEGVSADAMPKKISQRKRPPASKSEMPPESHAEQDWWDKSLTGAGRANILKSVGLMLPNKVLWKNMKPAAQAKVRHMMPPSENPAQAESPAAKPPKPKQAPPAAKPIGPANPANPHSLRSIVLAQGGISSKSLRKDYDRRNLKADGLLGVMRIKGVPLDELAQILESSGDLRTPSDKTPSDWLIEQLKINADGARAEYSDKDFEAQFEKEREEHERLKEILKAEGIDTAGLEELRQGSIEAGFHAGEEISDEKADELIDTSFDFGANVEANAEVKAEDEQKKSSESEETFSLKRPEKPRPKPEDFGTNPNTKQGGLFDAGKKGDKKGQELLFNSDPGDLNNPKTQENKAPAPVSLEDMLKDVNERLAAQGRVTDARLESRKADLERLIAEQQEHEKAVPWRRTADEERPAYNKRLKKEGWTPSPKPAISMTSSPGEVKAQSLEQQKQSPFKKGDRLTVHTGFSTDEMQIGGEAIEDSLPESPQVKVRVDSGKVHYVMAYYLGREKPAEKAPEKPQETTPKAETETDIEAAMEAELDRQEAEEAAAKKPAKPKTPKATKTKDQFTFAEKRRIEDLIEVVGLETAVSRKQDALAASEKELAKADSYNKERVKNNIVGIKSDLALLERWTASQSPAKPPRTKTGEKLGELSEKTGQARKAAAEAFLKKMKGLGLNSALGPINKDALTAAATMVRAYIADGTVKFADFVMKFAEDTSPAMARKFSDYLEAAWKVSGKRNPSLDQVGKVADILGPEKEVANEDSTGTTGTTDTSGREEDPEGSTVDRRDSQDTTGPADAGVLEDASTENDGEAEVAADTGGIRDSAGGKVRSGSGKTGSKRGSKSKRGGTDSGGTSSDDSGDGRGTDRAPQSTRPNYHLTDPDSIIGGSLRVKFDRNRKAIEIVRELEASGRAPTSEELDTLAGYMGWGAFGQELFQGSWEHARPKEKWEDADEWLRAYLGEEEWKSAQLSIVNAHFTDPQTVTGVWDILRRMGFDGGRVLEPSMGIGNFFSLMPRDLMDRSTLTGIELDKMTAKIAALLHPQVNVQQKGYQESQTPDNFYDVIVSNVPFGAYKIADRRYKQDLSIHNYFFKRAFDQVKPGGVIAFLTSNMTMDGKVQAKLMRAQIAKDGDLVTAIRFPSGAFQAYAGTKVVADLIIIRKRKEGETPQGDQNWYEVNEVDTPANQKISVNEYWQNHPENILGTMTWGHGTTSNRPGMIVNQPADLLALMNKAIQSAPENIINTERAATQGRERPNTTAMRQNSVLAQDNDLWIVKGEQLVPLQEVVSWHRKGSKQATIDKNRQEIESLLNVREAMRIVLDKQSGSEDATEARAELNRTYDAFVKEHGPIGKSAAAKHLRKSNDPMGNTLLALEKVTGLVVKKYSKRPIFERSTVRQRQELENPTINDAFAMERNRSLDLDIDRIAAASNRPVGEVISKLESEGKIYKTGNGTYDSADVFLAGNMARKLRQLEAAQKEGLEGLDRSIEAIRSRIPDPVPYSQIEAKLGTTWVEASDYADFIGHLLNEPASAITVERRITGWKVTIPTNINNKTEATHTHGHPGITFSKLMTAAMNNASVKLTTLDEDGNRVSDPEATTEANAKIDELRENFPNWLWASPERIPRLSAVYNEEFNSTVTPTYDDVPLEFEGMSIEKGDKPFNLRQHQMSAVWRAIVSGKGIFAHEVGTGKTLTMAALAMESRRLGISSKPILLAHNANSLAVRNEIQEAYPAANILYVDNLDAATKGQTLQAIATENWDLIVVPHSMAENFQLRPETVRALLQPQMDALEAAAQEAYDESDASDFAKGTMPEDLDTMTAEDLKTLKEPTAKDLVRERLKLRAMIDKAVQAMDKGSGVFFEDMGVDMVMVDEAHLFKKLPITSRQTIKGLNKAASQMGTMMMMMTDYIRSNNNGRGVYMFTGTPITNTINEIYNMMRFVMAEEMDASSVLQWDSWFNNFATQETQTELSSGGTWENFDRLSSFVNLPELRQMVGQYMDIVFADDMPEFKPRETREGRSENPVGRPFKQIHNVIIDMIDAQRTHSEALKQRYTTFKNSSGRDKVRMMKEPGGLFNPLVIEGEGVKLAMDPRLAGYGTKEVDDALVTDTSKLDPKDPNLKINKMIGNAMIHYHEHPKTAQMVFMQVGYTDWAERTVGRDRAGKAIKQKFRVFNLAKEIKRRLIEEGVPENEIAIFSGMSKEKRTEAASLMQQGLVRFAIGSTETMGTGINAQDELIAMHHLDAPWMPGDLEQRNGRGHRQGNRWNTVNEYRYLTEGPQDGRRWQVLLTKDRFIKEFMRGDSKARVIEMDDIDMSDDGGSDMEQTFASAAGDPRIMQRIRLEGQVERLRRQRDNHARTVTDTISRANSKLNFIKADQERSEKLTGMYETWKSNRTETPEITLRGKTFTGNQDITDQLQNFGDRYHNSIHQRTELGEYRGLKVAVDNGVLYVGDGVLVSAKWNLASLQSIMSNLPERINKLKESIEREQRFIDMAHKAVGEPFPKQKQLDSKQNQLDKLVSEMGQNPTVSPAWLRSGAPIGTIVYWKGTKYDVAGHRGTDYVLYSENDEFHQMPAAELTDAEGTPLFPGLEAPAETTTNPATTDPPAAEAPESAARKAAREAKEAIVVHKARNARYDSIIRDEWEKITRGEVAGSGLPVSNEMARAVAGRLVGSVRLGIKHFDAFIKDLRVNLDEDIIRALKPTLIRTWNTIREKHGLKLATDELFDEAMSDKVDVDVEQAVEAAMPEPAALASETGSPVDKTYSTKNAYTDAERQRLGMPERPPVERQGREESIDLAATIGKTKAGSDRIDNLIDELKQFPRSVTPLENDLLNFRYAELDGKVDDALQAQIAAQEEGDDTQEAVNEQNVRKHLQAMRELIEFVDEPIGTAAGRSLQARKAAIKRDFTMARSLLLFQAAHGRAPEDHERAAMQKQIDDLNAAIAALDAKLAAAEAKANDLETRLNEAHEAAVESVEKKPEAPPEPPPAVTPKPATPAEKTYREKALDEIADGVKMFKEMFKSNTPFSALGPLDPFLKIASGFSKLGVVTLGDFLKRAGRRLGAEAKNYTAELTAAWKQVRSSLSGPADISSITDKIDAYDPDTIGRAARDLHRYVIERDGLDASSQGREAAVDAVHEILLDFVPGLTRPETARAMSGIGIYSELSKDDIEVVRRDQKAQLLSLEQIGDWKAGTPPPATGQERQEISDEQRALRKLVNEAKKASGISAQTEGQLRSALDAAKRMAKNRITDLTKAIEAGKRITRSKTVLAPDAELTALQAERDALQKLYDAAFGRPELSEEQRLNRAEKALDSAINGLEADLKVGKLYKDAPKAKVTSFAIEAKKDALNALKATRDELRLSTGEEKARSDAAYARHLKEKIAELSKRLAENDYAPKPKKPEREYTPDMLADMLTIQKQKLAISKERKEWEFSQRHLVYRTWMKGPVAGAHMIRKGLTSIDQSLIGRQGGLLGIINPRIWKRSARAAFASNMIEAKSIFTTEQDLLNIQAALDSDPSWVRMEKLGKLSVTDVHGGVNREEDARFVPEWFDKLPGIGSSERAGSAFINMQRRLVFRSLVDKLATKLDGKRSVSNAELRVIGNFVNVSSGRGTIGSWTSALDSVTTVFFSPRWWASRINVLSGQPIWHGARWTGENGASAEVRKMIATEWAKQAAAQAAIMSIAVAGLMAAFGAPGDDEEWDWYWNWKSPKFGNIRIGSSYIDMTFGLGQHLSYLVRMMTGKQIDRWEARDIRSGDLFSRYMRGKLSPVASVIGDYFTGKSLGGEEFGSAEWFKGRLTPLMVQDINETRTEGPVLSTALSLLMFFGANSQTYEARVKERKDIANELRAMKKQGQSPEKIKTTLDKHLAHAAALEAKNDLRTADPDAVAGLQKVIDSKASPELNEAIQKEQYDLILNASGRVSGDPPRLSDDKDFTGSDDKSRQTSRMLIPLMIPNVNDAIAMYQAAYRAKNKSIYETVGKVTRKKASVWSGEARIRQLYK